MKPVLSAFVALIILSWAFPASATMYIRVDPDGTGSVTWTDGREGYYEDSEEGGGTVCFDSCRLRYFIFDDSPAGTVFDIGGQPVDEFFMYYYNEDTGEYEHPAEETPGGTD